MATVNTIAEEIAALVEHIRDIPGIRDTLDHEPKQIGNPPVITVQFSGFATPEQATLQKAKQFRRYDVRLYVGLEDFKIAQEEMNELFPLLWNKLISIQRLDDPANVFLFQVGESVTEFVTDGENRPLYKGEARIEIEHRSPYNP